jgi:hypothetical protein
MNDRNEYTSSSYTPPERPRTGVILAFLAGGALIVGLSMFSQYARTKPQRSAPAIQILEPGPVRQSDTVFVRFVTTARLMFHDNAWMAGDLHPHMQLADETRMAAAPDIVHIAADTFAWKITGLPPGTHNVTIFWADMGHIAAGDSSTIRLTIIP